jgi:glycerol-3-phosphate acyltransferase PlsX
MQIVVDAMGGDAAPSAPIQGAVLAARNFGVPIALAGRPDVIAAELAKLDTTGLILEIVPASEAIAMDELQPAAAVRRSPDSSIARGLKYVRQGHAEAFVSVGHTGAALAGASLYLGRLPGVRRPALAVTFPTLGGPCVLIDVGGNVDSKAEFLQQFGIMGAIYAERVLGVVDPRVGLVTIGEERGKGNQVVQAAVPLLEATELRFIGNIEGRDIPEGNADVAVMDGFTGNVLIKFAEGIGVLVRDIIQAEAKADPISMLGGLLMRPAFGRASRRMDYRAYGGATLLGARGMVVIGHGRSDAEGVKKAIEVALRAVENRVVEAIESGIARAEAAIEQRGDAPDLPTAVAIAPELRDGFLD